MGIFRKQTARAPLTTVFLVLLLALSIGASSIGFVAWAGGQKQYEAIDSQYTTIGILSGANWEKQFEGGFSKFVGLDSLEYEDGSRYIGPISASVTASASELCLSTDNSILLGAHIPGSTALTSGSMDPLSYHSELDDYSYSLSVFAVRCKSVQLYDHLTNNNEYPIYGAEFEIIAPLCMMEVYDIPEEDDIVPLREDILYFTGELYNRDGSMPFEAGKTYLLRGMYGDYPIGVTGNEWVINEKTGKEEQHYTKGRVDELGRSFVFGCDGDLIFSSIADVGVTSGVQNFIKEKLQYPDSERCYWTTPEGCWPYYAEYEGDWRNHLETEEGRVWKEEIIPNFEKNHSSATVILTNDLNTLYNFNSRAASVLEGRSISDEEYKNGSAVCMVSASYALLNGYRVGDTIPLEYYDTGYTQMYYGLGEMDRRQGITVQRFPLTADNRMNIQKDYTIIGIYTAPEWSPGQHSFHADTILVPKASVPGMDAYSGKTIPMLSSITIRNGSIDAFEAHMAANEKAGAYLYFDQGYSEAAATVKTLIENAMRLMLVGVAMFMLASMLFLLLYARRVSAVMRSMRLLGVPKKQTWRESLGMLVIQELSAVLLGNGLALVLYDRITERLLSGTPALDPATIALCATVQLTLLIAAGSTWLHRLASENLMQRTVAPKLKPTAVAA